MASDGKGTVHCHECEVKGKEMNDREKAGSRVFEIDDYELQEIILKAIPDLPSDCDLIGLQDGFEEFGDSSRGYGITFVSKEFSNHPAKTIKIKDGKVEGM